MFSSKTDFSFFEFKKQSVVFLNKKSKNSVNQCVDINRKERNTNTQCVVFTICGRVCKACEDLEYGLVLHELHVAVMLVLLVWVCMQWVFDDFHFVT